MPQTSFQSFLLAARHILSKELIVRYKYPLIALLAMENATSRNGCNKGEVAKALNGKVATQDGLMNAIKAVVGKYR